jgi:hypothetical protein
MFWRCSTSLSAFAVSVARWSTCTGSSVRNRVAGVCEARASSCPFSSPISSARVSMTSCSVIGTRSDPRRPSGRRAGRRRSCPGVANTSSIWETRTRVGSSGPAPRKVRQSSSWAIAPWAACHASVLCSRSMTVAMFGRKVRIARNSRIAPSSGVSVFGTVALIGKAPFRSWRRVFTHRGASLYVVDSDSVVSLKFDALPLERPSSAAHALADPDEGSG